MPPASHIFDIAKSLRRVFALPPPVLRACQEPVSTTLPAGWTRLQTQHTRAFATSQRRLAKPSAESTRRTQRYDEEIKARRVRLINANGQMEESVVSPRSILLTMDRKEKRLLQITFEDPNDPLHVPLCKIVDKKELFEKEKKRKANQRAQRKSGSAMASSKQLELNWAISAGDLSHRLDKMKEFLREGRKVEIFLARKKGGRKATPEECENLLDQIRNTTKSVEKATIVQELQGVKGSFATMILKGVYVQEAQDEGIEEDSHEDQGAPRV